MTLLELLVKELPGKGGWPQGWNSLAQGTDSGCLYRDCSFCRSNSLDLSLPVASNSDQAAVTKEQYEAALAASKLPAWNGEGLPPDGCACEIQSVGTADWDKCVLIAHGEEQIIFRRDGCTEWAGHRNNYNFRPIRTEAERRREVFAESLCKHLDELNDWDSPVAMVHAKAIYDAIAAGKIPGVKLEE